MIVYGELALLLNSLFLATLTFFVAVLLFLPVKRVMAGHAKAYSAQTRQSILWLVALAPWLAGAIAFCIMVSFPALPSAPGPLHFHHNAYEYEIFTWHSLVPIVFVILAGKSAVAAVLEAFRHNNTVDNLASFASPAMQPNLQVDTPHAFTSGLLNPKIYLSRGLHDQLSHQEYQIVQAHEHAHQQRRDPLKKYVFSFLLAFFPNTLATSLQREMALAIEQSADEFAATAVGDKLLVAQTLVRVAKLKRFHMFHTDHGQQCAFINADIKHRVRYLIDGRAHRRFPFAAVMTAAVFALLSNFVSADVFHHLADLIFHH